MNFLLKWGSPKVFYRKTGKMIPWLGGAASLFLLMGWIVGLCFSPADYQQGESVRIMYIHVPCAILSMGCFACMGGFAAALLIWQVKIAGVLLRSCAKVGAVLTGCALVTGALWGKPMWGTWWVWDARLTSELILWMLYVAILAIQSAFRQRESADKAMAVLALIGLVDLPIIHYSVNWWQTLHQGTSFPLGKMPLIDPSMLWPLGISFLGFVFFSAWAVLKIARIELLQRSLKTAWVEEMLTC
ncbi:MAG: heme ABC transporter permease CcmC [Gammaproteobacteria bacterium]|nr:heme ABC transporter permease CcmC [Gammaproteobacteria bacterium]